MSDTQKPGTFKKGDKRINRNGRPRMFDDLRKLTLDMFQRKALDSNGDPVMIEGRPATIIEAIMWRRIHSKNDNVVQNAVEIAYGKVPDKLDVTSDGEALSIVVRVHDDQAESL